MGIGLTLKGVQMKLKIKTLNEVAENFYQNHGHFHDGDAGLDLYIIENQILAQVKQSLLSWVFLVNQKMEKHTI